MVKVEQERAVPDWPAWRLRHVLARTGWNKKYVQKLVEAGCLERVYLWPGSRAWYRRSEVEALLRRMEGVEAPAQKEAGG